MILLSADAPGFTGDDIKVELHEGNVLVVTGEKQQKEEQAKKDKHSGENKVWRQERAYSSFSRAFTLPEDAKGDGITARMEHGVLTVVVSTRETNRAGIALSSSVCLTNTTQVTHIHVGVLGMLGPTSLFSPHMFPFSQSPSNPPHPPFTLGCTF